MLVSAVVAALGAALWSLSDDAPPTTAATEPAIDVQAPQQPSRPPPPPEREDFDPPPLPPSVTAPSAPPPPGSPMPRRAPKQLIDPETLARQTALLVRAREEVRAEPERALKTLVEFEQQFSLSDDAELVRLEAFLRLGRREDAETLGRKLIAKDAAVKKPVEQLLSRVRPR